MSFEYEYEYLLGAIPELESYLLSNELFWPISANPPAGTQPFPKLTLGGILFSRKRADAYASGPTQTSRLIQIENQIDTLRSKWRIKWEEKADREYVSRLNQWRNYIEEYRRNPEKQSDYYAYEIRWRVFVQLLENEIGIPNDAISELRNGLDNVLKNSFTQGDFVWEERLIKFFPEAEFWYLYGHAQEKSN